MLFVTPQITLYLILWIMVFVSISWFLTYYFLASILLGLTCYFFQYLEVHHEVRFLMSVFIAINFPVQTVLTDSHKLCSYSQLILLFKYFLNDLSVSHCWFKNISFTSMHLVVPVAFSIINCYSYFTIFW